MRFALLLLLSGVAYGQTWQPWNQLSNTALHKDGTHYVCPPDNFQPPGGGMPAYNFVSGSGDQGCSGVINAYNSAVADTKRNRLIIWGGGHSAYQGNEVYALDLATLSPTTATSCTGSVNGCRTNATIPTLTRLNNPSIFSLSCGLLADGNPQSMHDWNSLVYLPKADKMFGPWLGINDCGTFDADQSSLFLLDMATLAWTRTGYTIIGPHASDGTFAGSGEGARCALDTTGLNQHEGVYCIAANNDFGYYDVTNNTMNRLTQYGTLQIANSQTLIVDPDRKTLLAIGPDNTTPATGKIFSIELTSGNYVKTDLTSSTTGCGDFIASRFPSVVWDPTIHKVVGYQPNASGSTAAANKIVIFDPATLTCTTYPTTGGPAASSSMLYPNSQGMYGRFAYFPSLGKYVLVNDPAGDAYTFQLTANPTTGMGASSLYCVDRDGDGYGTGAIRMGPFTDLVIDGSNNKIISSASHSFVTADVSHFINVTGGSGFTVAENNTIVSVSGGKATMLNPVGTVSSTGGHWQVDGCIGADADDQDASVHSFSDVATKWGLQTLGGVINNPVAYLQHLGYTPTNIWYISPSGVDGTGVVNNSSKPYLTCCGVGKANPTAGDALMFRVGTYANFFEFDGTPGHPAYFLAYPGETPLFVPGSGTPCTTPNYRIYDGLSYNGTGSRGDVECANSTGVALTHIYAIGQEWGIESSHMNDFTISDSTLGENWAAGCGSAQHGIYVTNHIAGTPSTNVFIRRNNLERSCYNGVQVNGVFSNVIVEQNVSSSNDVGGIAFLNGVSNSFVRSNLSFNNTATGFNIFSGIDFCGSYGAAAIGSGCPYPQTNNIIENNTFYSSGTRALDGTTTAAQANAIVSVVNQPGYVLATTSSPTAIASSGSVTFNIATYSGGGTYVGNDIVIYSGNFYISTTATTDQPDINPADWGFIGPVSLASTFWPNGSRIRACQNFGQGNPCINATSVWNEGLVTGSTTSSVTISMDASTGSGTYSAWEVNLLPVGNVGGNTFRNNILVSYSPGFSGVGQPNFRYDDNGVYTATTTYTNNLFYNLYPTAGAHTNIIQTMFKGVPTYYDCSAAMAASGGVFGSFTGCLNADPVFAAANPAFWNSPSSFDFRLTSGSPAKASGIASTIPRFDTVGTLASASAPNRGAIEGFTGCGITPVSLGPWVIGQVINQTFLAPGCASSTWSGSGTWPTGLTFSAGVLSGTIGGSVGTFSTAVSYSTALNNYTIVVTVGPSCTITPTSLGPWTVGQVISQSFTATNCMTSTWSSLGTFPTGLTFSAGTLSGTIGGSAGTFTSHILYDTANNPYSIVVGAGGTFVMYPLPLPFRVLR